MLERRLRYAEGAVLGAVMATFGCDQDSGSDTGGETGDGETAGGEGPFELYYADYYADYRRSAQSGGVRFYRVCRRTGVRRRILVRASFAPRISWRAGPWARAKRGCRSAQAKPSTPSPVRQREKDIPLRSTDDEPLAAIGPQWVEQTLPILDLDGDFPNLDPKIAIPCSL